MQRRSAQEQAGPTLWVHGTKVARRGDLDKDQLGIPSRHEKTPFHWIKQNPMLPEGAQERAPSNATTAHARNTPGCNCLSTYSSMIYISLTSVLWLCNERTQQQHLPRTDAVLTYNQRTLHEHPVPTVDHVLWRRLAATKITPSYTDIQSTHEPSRVEPRAGARPPLCASRQPRSRCLHQPGVAACTTARCAVYAARWKKERDIPPRAPRA